jgi:small subunit ribosomal protein S11
MPREVLSRIFTSPICRTCRIKLLQPSLHRAFSTTPQRNADEPPPPPTSTLDSLSKLLGTTPSNPQGRKNTDRTTGIAATLSLVPDYKPGTNQPSFKVLDLPPEPHHLHIYSTKHNTHLTLTRPNRSPLLSFSAGNIGFRKAQRGSYDAAFQLSAYVFKMMKDRGLLRRENEVGFGEEELGVKTEGAIRNVEVVLRGYGKGREAVVKALMGNEGRGLRDKVVRVSDATRLKFGGTRSPKPRRLG